MQALIDFDGWRKWKDFADKSENNDSTSKLSGGYASIAPNKKASSSLSPTTAAHPETNGMKKDGDAERKSKRKSIGLIQQPVLQEEAESPPVEVDGGDN
jgi:osomolarity two-component system response regulator SSK1